MRQYIAEDEERRREHRERQQQQLIAEEQRIAEYARKQAAKELERKAVQKEQNQFRERMQQEVVSRHCSPGIHVIYHSPHVNLTRGCFTSLFTRHSNH